MMAADYYVRKSGDEWEAVERWENEGGRLRQRHDLSPDSIGEDYLRRIEQATLVGKLGEHDDIARAMLSLSSDGEKDITGRTPVAGGGRTLPARVSAV